MKKKFTRIFLAALPVFLLWACTDFITEDPWAPTPLPAVGPNYVPSGDHNLNVVYYIPADMDTVAKWHYRLSGMMLHARDFFRTRMYDYGIEKTLNLTMNTDKDGNETGYVRITCVRGTVKSTDVLAATTNTVRENLRDKIADEVLDYIRKNPYTGGSRHYMIIMPKESDGIIMVDPTNPWPNTYPYFCRASSGTYKLDEDGCYNMFGFAVCDHKYFDIRHLASKRARLKYLGDLGPMMHELVHALGVYTHDQISSKYLSLGLMGGRCFFTSHPDYTKVEFIGPIIDNPDPTLYSSYTPAEQAPYHTYIHRNIYNLFSSEFKLTSLQAAWLGEMQVFNKGNRDKTYYKLSSAPIVTISEVNVRKQGENWTSVPVQFIPDTLLVDIKFTASANVKFAFAYKDPWYSVGNVYANLPLLVTLMQQTCEHADIPRETYSDMDAVACLMELTSLDGNQYSATVKVPVQDGSGVTLQEGFYNTKTSTTGNITDVANRPTGAGMEIRFRFLFDDGYTIPWFGDVKGDALSAAPVPNQGYTTYGPSANKMRYTIQIANATDATRAFLGYITVLP